LRQRFNELGFRGAINVRHHQMGRWKCIYQGPSGKGGLESGK